MLNLEIVTPEKMVVNESVDSVRVPTGKPNTGLNRLKAPAITKRPIEPRNPPRPTQRSCGNPYGLMTRGLSRCQGKNAS